MRIINTYDVLNLTIIISFIGFVGIIFNRKNILVILMSVELVLLSINLNFAIFSVQLDDFIGQVFILFILTIAAAESALGLGLIIANY